MKKYGILFLIVASIFCLQAASLGRWGWMLVWPGLSFAWIGAAYLGLGPRTLGKRPDGTMAWYAVAFLLPYLLLVWLAWHAVRWSSRKEPCHKVAADLFIGRRPLANEVTLVVDLTSEFAEVQAVRTGRRYVSFPILDAGVPSEDRFRRVVEQVAAWQGPVYIHCAQGYGRTGLVAAAVLVAKGHAATAAEALAALKRIRPGLALSQRQRDFLQHNCAPRHVPPQENGWPAGPTGD